MNLRRGGRTAAQILFTLFSTAKLRDQKLMPEGSAVAAASCCLLSPPLLPRCCCCLMRRPQSCSGREPRRQPELCFGNASMQ